MKLAKNQDIDMNKKENTFQLVKKVGLLYCDWLSLSKKWVMNF